MADNIDPDVKIINSGCCHDCGGRCVLKAHVKNGKIIRLETDNTDFPQIRACMRGRAYRQKVYSEERLQYPLRRIGERGEGKFERITWDEALDEVASNLKAIKEKYGNSAILMIPGAGNQGMIHGVLPVGVLLGQFGGASRHWGAPSYEAALFASMATYGTMVTGNAREDLLNSKLLILWGWNPAVTIWDPGTSLMLAKVKEKGIKIIVLDPRFTDTAAVFADEWIPIRPGTDTAMLNAMAYDIIKENLQNQDFIDKYTTGFEEYKNYLFGKEDGIVKTPEWAESITKVPADVIQKLAREYANSKPAALIAGWGPARAEMGEQFSRAANVLTVITGNIGIKGGYASGFMRAYSSRATSFRKRENKPQNKKTTNSIAKGGVEGGFPPRNDALHKLYGGTNPTSARVHGNLLWDAILKGKSGGYPYDYKAAYIIAHNKLNQHANVHKGEKALKSLEFVVVQDQYMTPTAKFADIILPVNTFMERNDIAVPWLGSPYYIYLNKAIDSMYETKSDLEICRDLAKKMGIGPGLLDLDEDGILRALTSRRPDLKILDPNQEDYDPEQDDYAKMKRDGFKKIKVDEPFVAFKDQIRDPENYPFPTLSGKIEIFCEHIAEMENPMIPAIPKYLSHDEHYDSPLAQKYPLQLLTTHNKRRTHSSLRDLPWLEEIESHGVWINSIDAEKRNISDGDFVDIFNDRGRVRIPAIVSERIMPGVVNLCQGAWYNPDEEGLDYGGCANVLTKDTRSPGGAFTLNSSLVQIELTPKNKIPEVRPK